MAAKTMKDVIVSKGPKVEVIDSPIPKAGAGEVLIKVVVSGSNPKDWKIPEWFDDKNNTGDDIAGVVEEVGADVWEFRKGDRVAAFHVMRSPGGSYAEYAVAPAHTTFVLPPKTTFEEGAALPLAALTAVVGLYDRLQLPEPWVGAKEEIPFLIYGASSAVGIYTLQFAVRSNIHPIIAVAGRAKDYVEPFLDRSKGDIVIDYRTGPDATVKAIQEALKGKKLLHAYDAISEGDSYKIVSKALTQPGGKFTVVLPVNDAENTKGLVEPRTSVGEVHNRLEDLGYVYSRYISKGLQEGWFKAQRQQVVPGGLNGVQQALQDLKDGKASAVKYVFRIADTPGVGK